MPPLQEACISDEIASGGVGQPSVCVGLGNESVAEWTTKEETTRLSSCSVFITIYTGLGTHLPLAAPSR